MSEKVKFNVAKMAKQTGLAEASIRIYAVKFKLGRKIGRDWEFKESDAKFLKSRNKKRGRPAGYQAGKGKSIELE